MLSSACISRTSPSLLSRQAGDGGLGLREWGGSGSARYDHGGDGLGLTASLSPSWGVAGSAKDQLWSEIAPPFPTAQGDGTADASGNTASNSTTSNDAMRLESEIGYGFAAFSGNAVITPYGGLSLADGSRDWRLGGRLSFSPGLAISIEGTRKEQQNVAPDHGVQLDLNTAW